MAETILKKMVTINGAEYTITSDGKVYGKEGKEISVRPNTSGCRRAPHKGYQQTY